LTYGIGREPALAMDYDGGIKYYVCDHLGSVRTIFDEDGNVLSDHEYEPFGNEFFDTKEDNRLNWIGKEQDKESLLGDFGARKYYFLSDRFTSVDPLWEKYYEWSPYQYAENNPVKFIDPIGLGYYYDEQGRFLGQDPFGGNDRYITTKNAFERVEKSKDQKAWASIQDIKPLQKIQ